MVACLLSASRTYILHVHVCIDLLTYYCLLYLTSNIVYCLINFEQAFAPSAPLSNILQQFAYPRLAALSRIIGCIFIVWIEQLCLRREKRWTAMRLMPTQAIHWLLQILRIGAFQPSDCTPHLW